MWKIRKSTFSEPRRPPPPPREKWKKTTGFEKKLLKSIYDCLGRAPYYSIVADLLEGAFDTANGSLCDLNTGIIKKISSMSGFDTEFFFSSELGIVSDAKGDRLVDICQHLEAHKYLSPVGSLDYLLSFS